MAPELEGVHLSLASILPNPGIKMMPGRASNDARDPGAQKSSIPQKLRRKTAFRECKQGALFSSFPTPGELEHIYPALPAEEYLCTS